jgi:hypothetical protein
MPRALTKSADHKEDKRDASPKRKISPDPIALEFDHYLKTNDRINPEKLVDRISKAETEQQIADIAKVWRTNLCQFFNETDSLDLLRSYLVSGCAKCGHSPFQSIESDEAFRKAFEESSFVPICYSPRGFPHTWFRWDFGCKHDCVMRDSAVQSGYYREIGTNYYESYICSDFYTGQAITPKMQDESIHWTQLGLRAYLEGFSENLPLKSVRRFGVWYLCYKDDDDDDWVPTVALWRNWEHPDLYFTWREGYPVEDRDNICMPPWNVLGNCSLAEITWIAALGNPVVLDEKDVDEDVWTGYCRSNSDESESSGSSDDSSGSGSSLDSSGSDSDES